MHRTEFRAPLPRFHPQAMSLNFENAMPVTDRFRPSIDYSSSVPSVSYLEPREPGTYNSQEDFGTGRPNMVISSNRRFKRTFFTGPTNNFETDANKIVEKLEENKDLMEETPLSEQLRKEALRDLPECLTMKRCVKKKLTKSVSQKSKRRPIGFWKRLKYRINIIFFKFVDSLKNFNYFELWHGRLKNIEGHFGSGYASYFKFLRWLFVMNVFIALISFVFLVLPQIIADTSESTTNENNTQSFNFKDIFIGNGFFNNTVLYYGHYTSNTIEVIPHLFFEMPVAYFSVTVILYLVSFIVFAVSVAKSYRRNFIETEGGLQNVYANRVFCGWDYSIATKEAAELKSSSIYSELKELLSEELNEHEEWSFLYKFWTYTIQVVVNIFVLMILGGVGWLTWVLLQRFFDKDLTTDSTVVTAIVINIIIMFFPTIFNYISKFEDYRNPRVALYITLVRTYLLGSVIIGVILAFWLKRADRSFCWENLLASEIYRLIIFDFLFSVIGSFIINVGYFIGRYFYNRKPKSDFNVAKHTLQIIYNQGLFWVGFFYSPILPIIVTIKMFIIWYVTEFSVQKFCRPPKRTWRAAQTQTWFMMMVFVAILLIIAVQGYTLNSVLASSTCGPFTNYNYTYEIVTLNIGNLEQYPFWRVVMNVAKPGGVTFILIALIILVYYVKEQASATREKVKLLRETLVWLAKDKKFLVREYNKLKYESDHGYYFRDNQFVDPRVQSQQHVFDYVEVQPQENVADNRSSASVSEDEFNARFKKYS